MDLAQRMGGKLPEIDIAGTMFYVDVCMRELRSDYRLNAHLPFDAMASDLMTEGYRFAYNTETKQLVEVYADMTEWPENVVVIDIPSEEKLDPYGFARRAGLDPVEYVKKHPIQPELKARIIPLEKTAFPGLIEKNKRKQLKRQLLPKKKNYTKGCDKGRSL